MVFLLFVIHYKLEYLQNFKEVRFQELWNLEILLCLHAKELLAMVP